MRRALRPFVMDGAVAGLGAREDTFVACGRLLDGGSLVELGAAEEVHATFPAGLAGVVATVTPATVEASADPTLTVVSSCAVDERGDVIVVANTQTLLSVRRLGAAGSPETVLVEGSAFSFGLDASRDAVLLLGATADLPPDAPPITPRFPANASPVSRSAFVMSVPRIALDLGP